MTYRFLGRPNLGRVIAENPQSRVLILAAPKRTRPDSSRNDTLVMIRAASPHVARRVGFRGTRVSVKESWSYEDSSGAWAYLCGEPYEYCGKTRIDWGAHLPDPESVQILPPGWYAKALYEPPQDLQKHAAKLKRRLLDAQRAQDALEAERIPVIVTTDDRPA